MPIYDFSRSFVTFHVPGNKARIGVEATCTLIEPDGTSQEFVLFASCKAEDTYAATNLFRDGAPNYDFSGVFSDDRFRIERIQVSSDLERLDTGLIADRFELVERHLVATTNYSPLNSNAEIIQATLNYQVLIARTDITDPATGRIQELQYPVKTMNVNPAPGLFQVDTGPVLFYDFSDPNPDVMARFRWAYIAYNTLDRAYFIIQGPTPAVRQGVEVARTSHYSVCVDFPASNSFMALWS